MGSELITGVSFFPLPVLKTTGGSVLHAVRGIDNDLPQFGECYFSTANCKEPKAWKKHTAMICNLFVPTGKVKFVFYDDREYSSDYGRIAEIILSESNYGRLVIRPGIWFGFSGIADGENLVMNVSNILHDIGESERLEPGAREIPYEWQFDK